LASALNLTFFSELVCSALGLALNPALACHNGWMFVWSSFTVQKGASTFTWNWGDTNPVAMSKTSATNLARCGECPV
jgi:hypothetical protein